MSLIDVCEMMYAYVYRHPFLYVSETWYGIDDDVITRWVNRYKADLVKYDGFIVTHTPVFARLFEGFDKPLIMVCFVYACLYAYPNLCV